MIEPIFFTHVSDLTDDYGKFVIEPLAPSFGQSMGNTIRRTLLSSLVGAAITHVKFEGAPHLFTTIKGVKESMLEVVLSLKTLRFSYPKAGTYTINLKAKGKGKVYAKDIEGEVKVINGDAYLAEITDDKAKLDFEAVVSTGYGFVPSEEQEPMTGFVTVDSSFAPIKRVNFKVEEARVGRKSNHDRLIMEVWTDGTMSPKAAMEEVAKIITAQFAHIFSAGAVPQVKTAQEVADVAREKENDAAGANLKDIIIDELNLPSRVINALLRENIETVADLIKRGKDQLVGLKGVGRKSIDLIEDELKKMDIELK